jgi:2-keto-4-pentenoate hydratase/2-oxohepta-3-ene-1,7-dioic acid hydratase in catechol pathway
MKLASYLCGRGPNSKSEHYGVLAADRVACLPALGQEHGMYFPPSLKDFVDLGVEAMKKAEHLLESISEEEITSNSQPIEHVKLLAPIAFPPKIICLGLNYPDHVSETGGTIPDEPIIFIKPHTTIIGPNENIVKPEFVKKLDYEAELAVVMGSRAKNVSTRDAGSHIFGYTILNDVSARDIQFKDKQWTRGKGLDTFAPTGPCIATANQLREVNNLSIRTWVNGEPRQNSTTKNMVFNVYEIVHHLSRIMTLEPCDIIATGTPAGVGFAMKPDPKYLQPGDTVRIEIEKIGVLENRVVGTEAHTSKERLSI